jgi:hypothetical protein
VGHDSLCPTFERKNKMQYWKNFNNGKIERLEDGELQKHPEKLESLQRQGYIQITSETDDKPYSKPKKRIFKKKKKSKK